MYNNLLAENRTLFIHVGYLKPQLEVTLSDFRTYNVQKSDIGLSGVNNFLRCV